ncbi:hypothetical protein JCM33374_g5581 [Metschnikowia sp. JCM 33374]|nr:hypothetical protein JCM33374_g5581 [Metschnikowia sp. JCM 33374]
MRVRFSLILLSINIHSLVAAAYLNDTQFEATPGEALFPKPEVNNTLLGWVNGSHVVLDSSRPVFNPVQTLYSKYDKMFSGFIDKLRLVVASGNFDVGEFETKYSGLRNDLAEINFSVEETFNNDTTINKKLSYLGTMFHTMAEASEKIQRYRNSFNFDVSLAPPLIDINIKLLLMHNSDGMLDVSVQDYAKHLFHTHCALLSLASSRRYSIGGYPLADIRPNKKYFSEAVATIEALKLQIEGDKSFWNECPAT